MQNSPRNLLKTVVLRTTSLLGVSQSEERIADDSQKYWADPTTAHFRAFSHWKGDDAISQQTWHAIGQQHVNLFHELARITPLQMPVGRVIEWGCGGGANAVHFAGLGNQFVGVDLSQSTLDECAANLREAGFNNFFPVLIDVAHPEKARDLVPGPCDIFLCTYVFELIPSPAYGRRLLEIAHHLLRPGGVALVQIKYATGDWRTQPRRWGYRHNLANMTTYRIDEFWQLADSIGLKPKAVTLQPIQSLVNDERYAYFLLEKPAT
ncbi:MAG: class I SAM-dependent methyltransferase [Burkholderiales bacterium]|nr:class I SAM-dependent methyltransferase [Phycisphaerae bacterium]